jgi:Gluconate 2-dehydrogenase subunit 3
MNRRELIKNIALMSGGLFIGSNFLLTGCKNENAGMQILNEDLLKLLAEVAETIIPETDTAGAKTTKSAEFISKVFTDIYTDEEQKDFINALNSINDKAKEKMSNDFVALSAADKTKVINEVKDIKNKGFVSVYQMVLFAYMTSEQGLQATSRYTPVPGKYIGDVPYKKGEKRYVGLDG